MLKFILDGEWHQGDAQAIQTFAPGQLDYPGVFETFRTFKSVPFLFDEHLRRAERGLAVLGFSLPVSLNVLREEVYKLIKESRRQNLRMRMTFWNQGGKMHYAITASPFKPYTVQEVRKGFSVTILPRDRQETDDMSDVKSLDYDQYLSAYHEAVIQGYQEALLLNHKGHVYEGSRTNLFIVKQNVIKTPDLLSGCLNGVTRQYVLRLFKQAHLRVDECKLTSKQVLEADEIFLTNSILGVMPVTYIRHLKKVVGPITMQLMVCLKSEWSS